jgi:gamma-glutamyl-gamma-aminobutyrate hydrolase PuuD
MKTLLISPRLEFIAETGEERVSLDTRWFEFLKFCGLRFKLAGYVEYDLENIDGIILSGGNDLSCFSYSYQNKKRDDYEVSLVDAAIKSNLPVLGVCRGAQLLAQMYDSKLAVVRKHVRTEHRLVKKLKSELLGFALDNETVNSFHNFGITDLGSNLRSLAKCEDGTIEAFEHNSLRILGILWHPERVENFCSADEQLVRRFFEV